MVYHCDTSRRQLLPINQVVEVLPCSHSVVQTLTDQTELSACCPLGGWLQMLFMFEILIRMKLMTQPIPQTPFLDLKTMTFSIDCYLQSFPLSNFNKNVKRCKYSIWNHFSPCKAGGVGNCSFSGYTQSSLFSCSRRSYLKIINPVISYQFSGIMNQLQSDGLTKHY